MNNNSLQNANITCKRCSDRKFEEPIMASQFLVIYFQTIQGLCFLDFGRSDLLAFHNRSELLPGIIFDQSRKLHKVARSFMTLATLRLKVIFI